MAVESVYPVRVKTMGQDDMGSGFYRELVDILRQHGCHFLRPGKGSHEIWFSPATNRTFTLPTTTKSRHTANEVLKQAGLKKSF